MKQQLSHKWNVIRTFPIMLAMAFVPLIVTAKKYSIGLSGFSWFSNSADGVDLFLYWKGQALILLAFVMLGCLGISLLKPSWRPDRKKFLTPEMAWVVLYLIFASLSTVFSEYRDFAWKGSYEQWEGLNVILAYGVLFIYTYLVLDSKKAARYLVYAVIAGSFVMGLIGTFQYIGMDLFRSDAGQVIMNFMSETKMKYTFNFSVGWVYATLYNPNYVGSYGALVLPVLVAVALIEWKKIPRGWTVTAMVAACLMTVTLLGSQSLTGCVGVIVSVLFFVIYRFPVFYHSLGMKKIVMAAVGVGVFLAVAVALFPEEIQAGVDKLFHPTQDYHVIQKMVSGDSGLEVTTVKGDTFCVDVTGKAADPFVVTDKEGNALTLKKDEEMNYYTFDDEKFDNIRLYPRTISVSGDDTIYDGVKIFNPTINKEWTLAKVDDIFLVYNAFGKLDDLQEIPAWGFADCQHFGDKRGYIWSRTIPLLKKYIFLGSGPNTFTMVFPNNDYVGKTNMNYNGVTVTKPHNMYFQIWVQTGLISLIAFLLLVFWYLVKSVRLYWCSGLNSVTERMGFAVMISVFGYMVTGIANDSTVAVAPLFWGMLALGMELNRMVKISRSCEDGKGGKNMKV